MLREDGHDAETNKGEADQRRKEEETRETLRRFEELRALMPNVFQEMAKDLRGDASGTVREFAVVLSIAICVSLAISLTLTPMMCAKFLRPEGEKKHGRVYRASEWAFDRLLGGYKRGLDFVLRHQPLTLLVTIATACLSVYLYMLVPKGFFPQQDTGRISGSVQAAQDISFSAMKGKMTQFMNIVIKDPAVATSVGFAGGNTTYNTGRMFMTLKPLAERKITADQVIARLRSKLAVVPGATLYLQSAQDLTIGGRMSQAQFQYTLQGEDLAEMNNWAPRLLQKLRSLPELRDVNTDQQVRGLQSSLVVDRDTASRLGVNMTDVDNTLGDAFGQRQVSNIYKGLNQYHVVLEVSENYTQGPEALNHIYVPSNTGKVIPLSSFAHYEPGNTSLSVNHQGLYPSITLSFNIAPGIALSTAVGEIEAAQRELHVPPTVHGGFQGTAQAFKESIANYLILLLTALGAVYIVLGILYESYIHPITILSTIPSAGIGALLALRLTGTELSMIAIIGIILLIGIVKKNAILMIDFAVQAEMQEGKSPEAAIYQACLLRFRPILMTTMAALLGALPLALGQGVGSELRRPLGIAIVGGLIVSQLLTLFTTPVVYLYLDRFQSRIRRAALPGRSRYPVPAHSD